MNFVLNKKNNKPISRKTKIIIVFTLIAVIMGLAIFIEFASNNSSINEVKNFNTNKTYTAKDIANDPQLYAVGKTKDEYVVAKVSNDKKSILFFANGKNSDGIMQDWKVGESKGAEDEEEYRTSPQYINQCENIIINKGITYVGADAFYQLKSMKHVELANSVKQISIGAFYGCNNLKKIEIPKSVEYIDPFAFHDCNRLNKVVFNNGLKYIGYCAFAYCCELNEITFPSTLKSIDEGAFNKCTSLKKAYIPKNVDYLGPYVFGLCQNIKTLSVSKNNKSYMSSNNIIYTKNKDEIVMSCDGQGNVKIPSSVKTINVCAFSYRTDLKTITIPKTVEVVKDGAFIGTEGLSIYCAFKSKPKKWNKQWNLSVFDGNGKIEYFDVNWMK